MNIFTQIKDLTNMPQVAKHYGIEIKRGNMAICPFHGEKTPSLKLYEDHFHCFGCSAHGDVITFVSKFFNLSPIQAASKLNTDLTLNLDVNKPLNMADIKRINEMKKIKSDKEKEAEWLIYAEKTICDFERMLSEFKEKYAPKSPDSPQDKRFIYACHNHAYAKYLKEEFLSSSKDEKLKMKGKVSNIEHSIKEFR